jgi:hypothetical protein
MIFNDAFGNTDNELDKMARDLNNKKNGFYNNVKKNNKSFEVDTIRGIEAFANEPGFQFAPQTGNYKGDFISGLPTPLEDNNSINDNDNFSYNTKNSNDSFSLGNKKESIYSDNSEHFLSSINSNNSNNSSYLDNDIISEYSFLPKKKKKHLRLNTKHLQEYTENDDRLILEHIKNCNECKTHLVNLLKNENHFISQKNTQNIQNTQNLNKEENSLFGKINYKELKEVIILIIIGIIIIFILDIFLRR